MTKCGAFLVAVTLGVSVFPDAARGAPAEAPVAPSGTGAPVRPVPLFNRWQENWSVLANPAVHHEAFDSLKYIPLAENDSQTYLSLGANARVRFASKNASAFGVGASPADNYVLTRLEVNADLRVKRKLQLFFQLTSAAAPGKDRPTPVDKNGVNVEQGFIAVTQNLDKGTCKFRIGRQEMAFDLQRFISVRDGANVRQAYDAVWGDYERGAWRLTAFYSHPVHLQNAHPFDDYSSGHLTYAGARLQRRLPDNAKIAVTVARYTRDHAKFLSVSGNERRTVMDIHADGADSPWDWDIEAMKQTGSVGVDTVGAWAFGSLVGYTVRGTREQPRFGLQVDGASGDRDPNDRRLGTFNPMFPNGYYLNLSGLTGFVNFIHVKPSITLRPTKRLTILLAAGGLWRDTTADAVYMMPDIPVAGTAGRGHRFTATYGQLRVDWAISEHFAGALEADRYFVGDTIRQAGGHDSDYLAIELRYAW